MKKRFVPIALFTLMLFVFSGCAFFSPFTMFTPDQEESAKSVEETQELAKVEVYTAKDDRLMKTIDDSEFLSKLSEENEEAEDQEKIVQSTTENRVPLYKFVAYKTPAALSNNQKYEKIFTITIFENSNLIRTEVASEAIKSFPVPSEYLTFYEEVSNEKIDFFLSLAKES
ncbi:hypothetical protein [Faecalispora anaeroviscerum]|uniref:hypothetical protein n=1 Tax=Faecalispora anaeroviscerum TaxID=2991836 RepID=UPI0024BA618A|nr:hypothetical protein [Faecalispora anaeroviscerum]